MKTLNEIKDEVANLILHEGDWYGKIQGWSQWERNAMPSKSQYDIAWTNVSILYANQFKSEKRFKEYMEQSIMDKVNPMYYGDGLDMIDDFLKEAKK